MSEETQELRFTPTSWAQAKAAALEELGLTYEQLREQAMNNDFSSLAARKLWVIIGE